MATKQTMDVPVGSKAHVEIVKTPTNEAAVKTLRRILAKDPEIAAARKRDKLTRFRSMRVKQRGGRPWEHRPAMRPVVEGKVGDSGTVRVTADLLPDLRSVSRFVKVTQAK